MARTKGMLNLSGNLEVNAGAPLDARSVVPTVADLTVASNFQYKYVGMPVVVQATGDMYILTANDVTVAANWKQVGSGGGGSSYTAGDGIVIEDDEISTDNMPAADMAEIVTPLPSVMSRLPRYSTEEQIVGYWLDGKPLYQRCILATTPSETETWNNVVTIPDAETIIILSFMVNRSSGMWIMMPHPGATSCVRVQNNQIQFFTMQDDNNKPARVIVQYTKTTD